LKTSILSNSIEKLAAEFAARDWKYLDVPPGSPKEKMYEWPGQPGEEIMVCVHKGKEIHELFHRQDFFFFNFAYKGAYGAFSYRYDNHITVCEGECYIGQPYAGYALHRESEKDFIIIGILIQKDMFFRSFLPILSSNARLFHFFLNPQTNEFSDEFIRLKFDDDSSISSLLEMMITEYADKKEDTQAILKPLVLALFMLVARQYAISNKEPEKARLSDQIVQYMGEHTDIVTLKDIAAHFSYHPNYISTLLHKELGKSFSEILLEQRMERAAALLKETTLTIEEIALMLGYSNSSNFHKAFRGYYGTSPREYGNINSVHSLS